MDKLTAEFPVEALCRVLQVSRSGYYKWRQHRLSKQAQANGQLLVHIRQAHLESRRAYGSPRITQQLRRQRIGCSENRVARLMRQEQIRAKRKRPFRPRTTDSRHNGPIAPNRLREMPQVSQVNRVWAADITYIWTKQGWLYLAAVMDLCSHYCLLFRGKYIQKPGRDAFHRVPN